MLTWKTTDCSTYYHVLSLRYLCFLTPNRLNLHIDYNTCVIICYFLKIVLVVLFLLRMCNNCHIAEAVYNQWAMNPLFINRAICFKILRICFTLHTHRFMFLQEKKITAHSQIKTFSLETLTYMVWLVW